MYALSVCFPSQDAASLLAKVQELEKAATGAGSSSGGKLSHSSDTVTGGVRVKVTRYVVLIVHVACVCFFVLIE